MSSQLETLADDLTGRRVNRSDRFIAVSYVNQAPGWIVPKLVCIVSKLDGGERLISRTVEDLARSVPAAGDHNAIQIGEVGNSLRLVEPTANGVNFSAAGNVQNHHRVIAVDGGERTSGFRVNRHVVEASFGAGHGDDPVQMRGWSLLKRTLVRQLSPLSRAGVLDIRYVAFDDNEQSYAYSYTRFLCRLATVNGIE